MRVRSVFPADAFIPMTSPLIDTALREFEEETGIGRESCRDRGIS